MGSACCSGSDVPSKQNDVKDSPAVRSEKQEELVPQISATVNEWTVKLEKGEGSKLGVDVDLTDNSRLMVEKITLGLVADWNKANPTKEVKQGDRIMSVNGTKDDARAMATVCQEHQSLELVVRRE
mmetsp:Transcript_16670/g.47674  ORF Transcript_16670/g.47674 Transcript_16670/m.47674 type:complete len:126 (-) Transcript_16670:130-507(-)|eukprot:CAMPEP_0176254930 /NCGR_PEP_ID=MMETSP0121_2-20121125/36783_1 /TAXON_ID=160619 /ORGANISM="Kryptoperidinium foliaceum, Strain CCMP 1326" /LENGTH=125 /DNA_ID=CAMNT_0017594749 /DNA_START=72 /DNA_END=449 /DNA_ORIENTATION=-